jgi:zinc transport system substrate-binding protein
MLALAVVSLAGCARPADDGRPAKLSVVVAFFPVAEAARRIGGDRVHLTNLTPPGVEPHDLELTTKALDHVLDADLVLYLGERFQPALEDAVKDARGETVDLLDGLDLHRATGEEAEETGGIDPHVWLDPTLWSRAVTKIGSALGRIDPMGAGEYRDRTRAYRREVGSVGAAYAAGLAHCDRDVIVTAHAAFGYLAARYGLHQQAIAGVSPETEPDPRRLAELADIVKRNGVTTVFTEELVSPKVARALARETGVRTAVLDPMESEPPGGWAGGMRRNLRALRTALGCP